MVLDKDVRTHTRSALITEWYVQVFPKVAAYVRRSGGHLEEAKEVFQEAIVDLYERLSISDFSPERSNEAYLFGIAKNKWLKYASSQSRFERLNHIEIADKQEREPITQKLLHYLKQSGEKCMDMLQAFYYENLTMLQLANRFGYTSERSATVQKYKCLEKIRDKVKHQSLRYEDFFN